MPARRPDAVVMRHAQFRRNDFLHFGDRNYRQLLDEEQEPHREPAEASGENREVHPCRRITSPLPWLELVRERRHDDDESLEPHSQVDEERENEEPRWISSPALFEERERKNHVACIENGRR